MAANLRAAIGICLALAFSMVSPAGAVFFPGVQRPVGAEAEIEREQPYWAGVPDRLRKALAEQVGGLALNADYLHNTQDFVSTFNHVPLQSETELNTYTIRPEFVMTNWLSMYAIGALHEGSSTTSLGPFGAADTRFSLDGWGVGAGVTVALGLPKYTPPRRPQFTFDPLFVVPDFNWTHNDFDDVENAVDVLNLTIRIGAAARTDYYNWGLYAGPMYQSSTPDLLVKTTLFPDPIAVESRPEKAWSGVIGAFFGTWFGRDVQRVRRPTVMVTVEGGVGNRQGALVSLRYEYDFLHKLSDRQ